VGDWIDSDGHGPRLYTDDERENNGPENSQLRCARRSRTPLTIGFALPLLGICATIMIATESLPLIS
jgi:hypothetical protein